MLESQKEDSYGEVQLQYLQTFQQHLLDFNMDQPRMNIQAHMVTLYRLSFCASQF